MATTPSVSLWDDIAARGVQAVVAELSDGDAIALNEQFGTHNYKPLPVNAIRAEGARVWDHEGREFIDAIGAYSAVSHGHLHPAVVNAAKRQLDQVAVVSRAFYSAEVGLFLQGLCDFTGLDRACPMNSGAEAIETCLKLARKWGYTVKGVPLGQAEIIVFDNNFHGRTITVVGFSTEAAYNQHFGPYTPGFKVVPFGDAEALRAAITPNTIAVLGEPIQAEGGILIPPDGYLTAVREICTENNVLLIWDEIQTGFYRTGTRFAWQYEPAARPDLMAVGKPLGGGLLPVSAAVGQNHVMDVFVPGDHGSTFGGNPLGAAVALQAMAEMERADFGRRSRELGAHAIKRLRAEIPNPPMVDLRGRGLLIGVEFGAEFDTKRLSAVLTANGLLTKETRKRTFRLTPALSIDEATLDELINRFVRSVHQVAEGA